jgi:hypothetical protein
MGNPGLNPLLGFGGGSFQAIRYQVFTTVK